MAQRYLTDVLETAYQFAKNTTLSDIRMEQLQPLSIDHDGTKIYLDVAGQHFPIKLPKVLKINDSQSS